MFWQVLTTKQFIGLVYVIIALTMAGLATVETSASIDWFTAAYNLDLHIDRVTFNLGQNSVGYPYVAVFASVHNSAPFNGLMLSDANYGVYVNSTTEPFNVHGSSEVGMSDSAFQRIIPGAGSLNMTYTFQILIDTNATLTLFLNKHTTDLVKFVGVTLYFWSSFGRYSIPYCYQLPENILTICPPPRAAERGGAGAG